MRQKINYIEIVFTLILYMLPYYVYIKYIVIFIILFFIKKNILLFKFKSRNTFFIAKGSKLNMLAKPPKHKTKIIPQPKSKRFQHEIEINDDNKENIDQKNNKIVQSNRRFGKDITNSISNNVTKQNSYNNQKDSSIKVILNIYDCIV